MIGRAQLPFLVTLVQDESPVVRERVAEALAAFGPGLERELDLLPDPPDLALRLEIEQLLREHGRQRLLVRWAEALEHPVEHERLEQGLGILSELQSGPRAGARLRLALDDLAEGYRRRREPPHPSSLARFLFSEHGLRGERRHYYDPANSDLLQVLRKRTGIPLTLVCAYLLVGVRLDLRIEGCNFPGHFLARAWLGQDPVLVDCFEGGRVVTEADMLARSPLSPEASRVALERTADARSILGRALRNLIRAYDLEEAQGARRMPLALLEALEGPAPSGPLPRFAPGAIVRHRRYGYRGVVVEGDPSCRADESWHRHDTPRPEREQPWYYVLVHGTTHVTYTAQASLQPDGTREPVIHPFIPHFFSGFQEGRYVRNDRPWLGR